MIEDTVTLILATGLVVTLHMLSDASKKVSIENPKEYCIKHGPQGYQTASYMNSKVYCVKDKEKNK